MSKCKCRRGSSGRKKNDVNLRVKQQFRKEIRDFVNLYAYIAHGALGSIQQLHRTQGSARLSRHSKLGGIQRLSGNIADISYIVAVVLIVAQLISTCNLSSLPETFLPDCKGQSRRQYVRLELLK